MRPPARESDSASTTSSPSSDSEDDSTTSDGVHVHINQEKIKTTTAEVVARVASMGLMGQRSSTSGYESSEVKTKKYKKQKPKTKVADKETKAANGDQPFTPNKRPREGDNSGGNNPKRQPGKSASGGDGGEGPSGHDGGADKNNDKNKPNGGEGNDQKDPKNQGDDNDAVVLKAHGLAPNGDTYIYSELVHSNLRERAFKTRT